MPIVGGVIGGLLLLLLIIAAAVVVGYLIFNARRKGDIKLYVDRVAVL